MPTGKPRAPAFAKSLILNRRRGFHPLQVDLVFGDDWGEASARAKREAAVFVRDGLRAVPYGDAWLRKVGVPMLALRPRDYAPGAVDFRCLTAVDVCVVDGCGAVGDWDVDADGVVTSWGLFYYLLGDVARWAAKVNYRVGIDGDEADAEQLARFNGVWCPETSKLIPPPWWPDDEKTKADRERRKLANWAEGLKRIRRAVDGAGVGA